MVVCYQIHSLLIDVNETVCSGLVKLVGLGLVGDVTLVVLVVWIVVLQYTRANVHVCVYVCMCRYIRTYVCMYVYVLMYDYIYVLFVCRV